MKLADLETESETLKMEAKSLAIVISAASLDERSEETLKLVMRHRMAEGISKIVQDLEQKARVEEQKTRDYPSMNGGKEVWIYFFLADRGATGYAVTLMRKESGPFIAVQTMQKHSDVWYIRHLSFVEAIEGLKQDILNGNYDEKLGTDPARLIFDALKDRAGRGSVPSKRHWKAGKGLAWRC